MTQVKAIQSSTRYERFQFDPANRPINQDHLNNLLESIKKKNLLDHFPIVVSSDFTVIDGQHRLKAAEILKLPIFYIISEDMNQTDVSDLVNKDWELSDRLNHFCVRKFPDYLILRQFWYPKRDWLSITKAVLLLGVGNFGNTRFSKTFSTGQFKVGSLKDAEAIAERILDFKKWIPFYNERGFIAVVQSLYYNPDYNHDRMMQKMSYLSSKMIKQTGMTGYYAIFTEIYNYKAKEDDRVLFQRPRRRRQ